jgi:hypothetical protein
MTTQEKVLAEIAKIAKAKKLDADVEFNWANTGRVYFRKGLGPVVANMSFDFQSSGGYLTAAFLKGSQKANYGTSEGKLFYITYDGSFRGLFGYLKASL